MSRSLDLHGYTREKALRQLSEALEACQKQDEAHLDVITGVGLHSQNGGAVLRPAVQKYLEERKFYYKYQSGCFEVEVRSGELRYAIKTAPPSTKLLHATSLPTQPSLPTRVPKKSLVRAATLPENFATGPSPREVAQDERVLAQGKQQSLEEYREFQKVIRHEQKAIDRALELSAHDDCSGTGANEERLLEAILERSKKDLESESEMRAKREEELLQQAIGMSMNDFTESSTTEYCNEEALFRTILEQSAIQANQDDEDELLRRAIELSIAEGASCSQAFVSQTSNDG